MRPSRRLPLRRAVLAFGLVGATGCLSVYAPAVSQTGVHAKVEASSEASTCFSCHVSQHDAAAGRRGHDAAPIVMDWMQREPEGCLGCHGLHGNDAP